MYKYSINCLPLSLCKLFVKNSIVHQHNTRNSDTLRVSKGSKTFIRISALVLEYSCEKNCVQWINFLF